MLHNVTYVLARTAAPAYCWYLLIDYEYIVGECRCLGWDARWAAETSASERKHGRRLEARTHRGGSEDFMPVGTPSSWTQRRSGCDPGAAAGTVKAFDILARRMRDKGPRDWQVANPFTKKERRVQAFAQRVGVEIATLALAWGGSWLGKFCGPGVAQSLFFSATMDPNRRGADPECSTSLQRMKRNQRCSATCTHIWHRTAAIVSFLWILVLWMLHAWSPSHLIHAKRRRVESRYEGRNIQKV